jgi:hypothetical protein
MDVMIVLHKDESATGIKQRRERGNGRAALTMDRDLVVVGSVGAVNMSHTVVLRTCPAVPETSLHGEFF